MKGFRHPLAFAALSAYAKRIAFEVKVPIMASVSASRYISIMYCLRRDPNGCGLAHHLRHNGQGGWQEVGVSLLSTHCHSA